MKIRSSWVANSSSASFILTIKEPWEVVQNKIHEFYFINDGIKLMIKDHQQYLRDFPINRSNPILEHFYTEEQKQRLEQELEELQQLIHHFYDSDEKLRKTLNFFGISVEEINDGVFDEENKKVILKYDTIMNEDELELATQLVLIFTINTPHYHLQF